METKIIKIVKDLRRSTGSLKKIAVLKHHENNVLLQRVLLAMYDMSISYYVSPPAALDYDEADIDDSLFKGLDMLSSRKVTGNAAKKLALALSENYGEIARLILGHSLKAGVSFGTIEKVFPGLIPRFKVMLAAKELPNRFPCLVSIKYDGVRLIATVKSGSATLQTRSGKVIPIDSIEKSLSVLPDGVYDGELTMGTGLQISRTSISGQSNRCLNGSNTDIPGSNFNIFDYVPIPDWAARSCNMIYAERYAIISSVIRPPAMIQPGLNLAKQIEANSIEEVGDMFKSAIVAGLEGVMIRYWDDEYVWDRSSRLLKQKAQLECVLTCTEVKEGSGKYEEQVGSLRCEGEVNGKEVSVYVGTGLSDFDRQKDHDFFIGKEIEIEYNDILLGANSMYYSLFLPVYKRVK